MSKKDGLYTHRDGGKTLIVGGHAKYFPPVRETLAYDSARGSGYGGQDRDRDDRDDLDDQTDADSIFGDAEEDRAFEEALGRAVSDGLRAYARARDARRRGKDGTNKELGQSGRRGRGRGRDADPDHRKDFDPETERERVSEYELRDTPRSLDSDILGQVPARSTMTLRDRTADSKFGFDARIRRGDRRLADTRTAEGSSGRAIRGSLLDELDKLFGGGGNA